MPEAMAQYVFFDPPKIHAKRFLKIQFQDYITANNKKKIEKKNSISIRPNIWIADDFKRETSL